MKILKELVAEGLKCGKKYEFIYTPSGPSKEYPGLAVKIKPEALEEKLAMFRANEEEHLARNEEITEECAERWTAVRTYQGWLDEIKAKKKEANIQRWNKFKEKFPDTFSKKEKYEKKLAENKNYLNEVASQQSSGEYEDDWVGHFFRYYVPKDPPEDDTLSYTVKAYFLWERVSVKTGSRRLLFLVDTATIDPVEIVLIGVMAPPSKFIITPLP